MLLVSDGGGGGGVGGRVGIVVYVFYIAIPRWSVSALL